MNQMEIIHFNPKSVVQSEGEVYLVKAVELARFFCGKVEQRKKRKTSQQRLVQIFPQLPSFIESVRPF